MPVFRVCSSCGCRGLPVDAYPENHNDYPLLMAIPNFMSPFCNRLLLVCLLWLSAPTSAAVHHALEVTVSVDHSHIDVTDSITVSGNTLRKLDFALHPGLTPEMLTRGVELTAIGSDSATRPPALNIATETSGPEPVHYRVVLPAGQTRFTLHYHGHIRHVLQQGSEAYARQFSETASGIRRSGMN